MSAGRESETLRSLIGEIQEIGGKLNDLRTRIRPIMTASTIDDSLQQVSLVLELLQLRTTVESFYDDLAENYTPDHLIVSLTILSIAVHSVSDLGCEEHLAHHRIPLGLYSECDQRDASFGTILPYANAFNHSTIGLSSNHCRLYAMATSNGAKFHRRI
jgi:hypothetical protein